MSDSIHYKGLTLKALNLYCKSQDGTMVFQAYESPLRYSSVQLHGCTDLCSVALITQHKCLTNLGEEIRGLCGNMNIIWRKLI